MRPFVTACVSVLLLSLTACGGGPELQTAPSSVATSPPPASGTPLPESKAPETQAPETQAPETQAPETQAPETQAPETQAPETQAPETQAPETQAPTPRPSRKAVLARPGTVCGEIQPPGGGPMAAVAVAAGRADCGTALRTFRTYYRRDTPKQGSAGVATVDGWRCASNSAAQANISGRLSTCQKAATKIVADVIP
ncbi:hypothetical protein [Nonomuraea sp. B19D2]|uniref:hypothetical protein n=1 Tax=Nonomuraea sp. B19D2 TaxID=3159561 RepID=UPI0032DAA532